MRKMWLVALLWGCPKRSDLDPDQPLREHLQAIDRMWVARASTGLGAVGELLDAVPEPSINDPRVRWRRTRYLVSVGLVATDTDVARRTFAKARLDGVDCATKRWLGAGGDVFGERGRCAGWAAMAWVRWMETLGGEAAAVDAPAIEELLEQAARSVAADAVPMDWVTSLFGAVLAGRPSEVSDEVEAQLLMVFQEGERMKTDDIWIRWGDLRRWAPERSAGIQPSRPPRTPEERAIAAR